MMHKIGVSMDPHARLGQLRRDRHAMLKLCGTYQCIDEGIIERRCHDMLKAWGMGGEWFFICRWDAEAVIDAAMAGRLDWVSPMPRWKTLMIEAKHGCNPCVASVADHFNG